MRYTPSKVGPPRADVQITTRLSKREVDGYRKAHGPKWREWLAMELQYRLDAHCTDCWGSRNDKTTEDGYCVACEDSGRDPDA